MKPFFIIATLIISQMAFCLNTLAEKSWPHPIPCRIQDGDNPDLFMMTLGDVNPELAQGMYDPVRDRVTLKDGTVMDNYYKETLGLKYYQPVDKSIFPLPPSGWCTWYYYYPHINAVEVKRNAKWLAENLKDYGAEYVQIDDGWQKQKRDWTTVVEEKFPDGMADVAAYIKSVGLTPGIWTAPHGQDNEEVIKQNPNVFLLKEDGTSASSTWEGKYLVDPTTPEAHAYLRDLFQMMCDWGYDYFKIDGQPIVVNEYGKKQEFMQNPQDNGDELYRQTLKTIRETIGPERYLLGCWGIPVEGDGYMNGSRTGGDIVLGWGGFQTALRAVMAHFYQHNIMWYVDPDVMVLRSPLTVEQARVWATLQGLTGQALMATDRMMDLSEERIEMLRRVYPAVNIRPLDLFSSQGVYKRLWDLKVNHLGRQYDVIGLFNFDETTAEQMLVSWSDLGLPEDKPIHVFDFWNEEYLGAWEAGMTVDINPTACRVLTLLPATGEIQLISTNRHITQGWVDLIDASFDNRTKVYSGKSRVIKNDPYQLRFVFPRENNFLVKNVVARLGSDYLPVKVTNHQGWATVTIDCPQTTEITWEVTFEPTDIYPYPVGDPAKPQIERKGIDTVAVTWNEQYWLNVGYQVYLDGQLLGYTPRAAFPLRDIDPAAEHTVEVETVWEDGTISKNKASETFSIKQMLPDKLPLSELTPIVQNPRRDDTEIKPVIIDGALYPDSVVMKPGPTVNFKLKGLFKSFACKTAITKDAASENDVVFVVLGDDKEIWRSSGLMTTRQLQAADIDISGVETLTLRVDGAGEDRNRLRGAWIDAVLIK